LESVDLVEHVAFELRRHIVYEDLAAI
jgi:hypothetical protein